uniref:WAT1-related protein n=1 Tax=Nicotiana tabacum TaxID=4097 RepID=A0A1S3Y2Y1_TOBAC|nr:PREDICTED: WAT1-related protein At3g18200-like [Nicotiana tabacum]
MEPKTEKLKLLAVLFVVVFLAAGFHISSRIALNIGVSKIVYLVYRNITALLFLGPFAYFLEKKERPPLTFSLLFKFFLGFLGTHANLLCLVPILFTACLEGPHISKGGPVFAATYLPVQIILVAVMAFVFLGDQLYSGVVFGGILIAAGLYLVLWGKTEGEKIARDFDHLYCKQHKQ